MNDISEQARQYVVKLTSKHKLDGLLACDLPSCHDRTWGILRGFVLVLLHHDCPKNAVFDFLKQWHSVLIVLNEPEFFRVAKFLCAYPQARFLKNEPPACDLLSTFPMSGNFRRWFRVRMNKYNKQNVHLFMSWFQVKRSALPASPSMVELNLLKHRQNMTANDRSTAPFVTECLVAAHSVLERIRSRIEPDFRRFAESKASQSASFFSTRIRGGQAGELSRRLGDWFFDPVTWAAGEWLDPPIQPDGLPNYVNPVRLVEPEEVKLRSAWSYMDKPATVDIEDASCYFDDAVPILVDASRVDDLPKDLLRMIEQKSAGTACADFRQFSVRSDSIHLNEFVNRMVPDSRNNFYDPEIFRVAPRDEELSSSVADENNEFLRARVAVVLEPLKVRTITAGPAAHYFLARMHQKALHSYLRDMPCFRLIGRPASPTDIMSIQVVDAQTLAECQDEGIDITEYDGSPYAQMGEYLKRDRFWYSADYQESTDKLSRTLSSITLQATMSNKWDTWRRQLVMSLKPHVVCYPRLETYRSPALTNGQRFGLLHELKKLDDVILEANENITVDGYISAYHAGKIVDQERRVDHALDKIDPKLTIRYRENQAENRKLWDGQVELQKIDGDNLAPLLFDEYERPYHVSNLVRLEIVREGFVEHADEDGLRVKSGGTFYLVLKRALPPCVQRNAQLMGSRLSFTILCLCNMSLYLAVRKRTDDRLGIKWNNKRVRFWLDRVLINGDDLLTQFTSDEIVWFNEIGNDIGLSMSVGKVYTHDRYANINSTAFDCPITGGHATEIPYLNSGLFFGQNKVLSRVGGIDELNEQEKANGEAPHIAVLDEVVAGALRGKQNDLLKAYLEFHKSDLQKECRGRNLFVAISLGGWGCKAPVGWTFHVTPSQQNEIARLYRSSDVSICRPFRSRQFETNEDVDHRPWKVVENLNTERPRLRKCRGDIAKMPDIDVTIERVPIGTFSFRE
jgi:hypothetical protein